MMHGKLTLAGIVMSVLSIVNTLGAETIKNEGLNAGQQTIVPIAAFTANGDLDKLKTASSEGLDAGLAVNEIKEILVQMYAYAGFPRSLNGIETFMSVLKEREQKGIKDKLGKEPTPMPANKSSIELGTEIQTRLSGKPVTGAVYTFCPTIDQFLKGHLFPAMSSLSFHVVVGSATSNVIVGHMLPTTSQYSGTPLAAGTIAADVKVNGF